MKPRARRRLFGLISLFVAVVVFFLVFETLRVRLRGATFFSGWTLILVMIFLSLYNVRKKFPVPPFGDSRAWLQLHIYAGFFTFFVFFAHVGGFTFPTGALEGALWTLYLGVAVSGVIGLFITRTFPQRLTSKGEEVVFERIPEVLRDLRLRAETLAERSVDETGAPTIAEFYTERIRPFLARPRYPLRHIIGYQAALSRRMNEIEDQYRYLSQDEQKTLAEIANCVRAKDALDHQYALQLALKTWLFVHIPLTYAVMAIALVHILLVYAFSGGPA